MPKEILIKLGAQASCLHANSDQTESQRRIKIEDLLDQGYGACLLKKPKNAQIVIDAWKYFNGQRYDLIAYVVMPGLRHTPYEARSNAA